MSTRVLITGAGGGIGTSATAELRARGAEVVGLDLAPGDDGLIHCDVRDQESVNDAVHEAVERLGGGLDVLINNAGVGDPQSAGTPPDETAEAVIDVNLMGPWRVTAAALPALLESRGRVVNVASGLAHLALPFAPAYCMSKRGLVAYSDALRLEHGDQIAVTTVFVGYIATAIHEASASHGIALEGAIPRERLEDAARTLAEASLGRAARDRATTRRGALSYALANRTPGRVMDLVVRARARQLAKRGHFDRSELAREYVARLKTEADRRSRAPRRQGG